MTMTDPIADLLTRIRNGQQAGHKTISVQASKLKAAIVDILQKEGFVSAWRKVSAEPRDLLEIRLRYDHEGNGIIREMQRSSTPGRRVYVGAEEIPHVRAGLGVAIISTSKGVMADHLARKARVGGEVICTVW